MKYAAVSDTEGIKRLLILLLLKIGTPSDEIGLALDIDPSVVRRVFPAKKIQKIKSLR